MRIAKVLTLFLSVFWLASLIPVNAQEDLIYVAVDPCRIVDTRVAGGVIAANDFRNFLISGTQGELAVQGGNTDCPDPKAGTGLKPLAVSAYVITVPAAPTSSILTAYPSDRPPPPAGAGSTVNSATGQVIGNTTNITLCNQSSCPTNGEFAILARNTNQHVVIDVQGYFYPAVTPSTHFYSVPAEAFKTQSDPYPAAGGGFTGGAYPSTPGFQEMIAPLNLPDGVIIKGFTMYFFDNDPLDLEMALNFRENNSGGFFAPMSLLESSGMSGDENLVESLTDSQLFHEVDNERFNYFVSVWANWPGTRALRINAAVLEYTINETL